MTRGRGGVRTGEGQTHPLDNRSVAALAGEIFVAYADPGGKTERLCREIIANGKPVFTTDCSGNTDLISMGARPASLHGLIDKWRQAPPETPGKFQSTMAMASISNKKTGSDKRGT